MTMTASSINADGARLLQAMSTTMHIKCLNDNSKQQLQHNKSNIQRVTMLLVASKESEGSCDSYNKCHVKGSRATRRRTSFSAARPTIQRQTLQTPDATQCSTLNTHWQSWPTAILPGCLSLCPPVCSTCGRGLKLLHKLLHFKCGLQMQLFSLKISLFCSS